MELRHLRYFVAVAEELNFRKASERLRVAQPALSSQIQDLEAELEVRLLDRNTGGVRLTAAGAAFLAETRLTLAQAERASEVARHAAQGTAGRLSIGYLGSLSMPFMPAVMKSFRSAYPNVEVTMVDLPAISEQLTAMDAGELQLAFSPRPDASIPEKYERLVVMRAPGRIAVGRSHRLAKATAIRLEDLAGEAIICLGSPKGESAHRDIVHRIFESAGRKAPATRLVDGPEALHALVAAGLGIAFLAETVSLALRKDIVLKKVKDANESSFLEVRAFWLKEPASLTARHFIEVIRRHTRLKK